MPFTIDFLDDHTLAWTATEDGASVEELTDWHPTFYVHAHATDASLRHVDDLLTPDPRVLDLRLEDWRPGFRHDHERMLAVDVAHVDDVTPVAHRVSKEGAPGEYRCFNVDFSPQFRYCLEQGVSPRPNVDLTTLGITVSPTELADQPITALRIDPPVDDQIDVDGTPTDVADAVNDALARVNPDVLVVSTAELVPALAETADAAGTDCELGRRPGWRQLAGESTYESYGRVGHSPARYSVPGRAIIDQSNTFFYGEAGLAGCLDLVARSWKPLQELAWASIGNCLTAIQIREARDRDVLVPWNSWRHEFFKRMDHLHAADRGGHTISPSVGVHDDVHELDFQSLYPNIICQYNVSPDTIRCDCHADREDVPDLGYAVCDEHGYLVDVLQPLIDDRAAIKAEIPECEDPARRERLEGKSSAIKWILVSCFGYQGFSNAKFGRIECHEAINAYARQILLDAKARLEAGGWQLVHGIVDSLWVTPRDDAEQTDLRDLAAEISSDARIALEYEGAFDWIAFVPMRDSDAGALTKYFGKRADPPAHADAYKFRGIECRQRSTPQFVERAQEAMIDVFDRERSPDAVCACLGDWITRLERGDVGAPELLVRTNASKDVSQYEQHTRTVAALQRATDAGLNPAPGQDVEFVVVNDDATTRDRVELAHELSGAYDPAFYRELLVRAAESVVSPVGWREDRIKEFLADTVDTRLTAFQ